MLQGHDRVPACLRRVGSSDLPFSIGDQQGRLHLNIAPVENCRRRRDRTGNVPHAQSLEVITGINKRLSAAINEDKEAAWCEGLGDLKRGFCDMLR